MAGLFIKLDCDFWDHPKIVTAGVMAGVLYQRMSMYCMQHTTDGLVPDAQLPRFAMPGVRRLVAALVAADLVEQVDGGWLVPGYVERYRSAAEVEALSRTRARAGRMGGRPRKVEQSNGKPSCFHDGSKAKNPEVEVEVEVEVEELASSDTSVARPPAAADAAGPAESVLGVLGIVGATPTAGERAIVARCVGRGWTVEQLQAKAARALDADRPRAWLVKALEGCANEDPPAAPTAPARAAQAGGGADSWSAQWALMTGHRTRLANEAAKAAWFDTRQTRRYGTETDAKFAFRDAYVARSAEAATAEVPA